MESRRSVCAGLTDDLRLSQDVIELTGRQLRHLQGSYVYWLMIREQHDYIGMKAGSRPRPFERDHHVIGQREIRDHDRLLIFPMPNGPTARWVEAALIDLFGPDLNRAHPTLGPAPNGFEDEVLAFLPPPRPDLTDEDFAY